MKRRGSKPSPAVMRAHFEAAHPLGPLRDLTPEERARLYALPPGDFKHAVAMLERDRAKKFAADAS